MSSSKKRTFAPRESDRGSSIKSEDQPQTLYSFRNGTVNAISLAEFSDFKEKEMQRIEATKKPKGFHSIRISDSLAYKKANPQTKLWYYDKNQYKNAQEIDQEHYSEEEEEEELEEEVPVKKASVIKAQQQVPEIETPPEDPKYLPTLPELMLKKVSFTCHLTNASEVILMSFQQMISYLQ